MAERRSLLIIAITIIVAVILGWAMVSPEQSGTTSRLASSAEVTDPAEIQNAVQISDIGIATGENFVGHRIRYVVGTVKNVTPDKPIRLVEVKLVFSDFEGKSILENVAKAYEATTRFLAPGAQHEFQIGFEKLPQGWNYRRPEAQIVRVVY